MKLSAKSFDAGTTPRILLQLSATKPYHLPHVERDSQSPEAFLSPCVLDTAYGRDCGPSRAIEAARGPLKAIVMLITY